MQTILHVEDDEFIRRIVKTVLEREGYKVIQSNNAQEGINLAHQTKPILILMDMWLPNGMDGWEATRLIKADDQLAGVYVVALTAQGGMTAQQRAHDAGCDAYLVKPFEMRQLLDCVHNLIG